MNAIAANDVSIVRRARGKYVLAQERVARDVVVLLDVSTSMRGTKLMESKQSIGALSRKLSPDDRFGLNTFSGNGLPGSLRVRLPLREVQVTDVYNALSNIAVGPRGTPFYDSLSTSLCGLASPIIGCRSRKPVLVVLTDGEENRTTTTSFDTIRQLLINTRNVSVYLIGVGLGSVYKQRMGMLCAPPHCHYHDIANFTGNISEAFEAFQDWIRHPEINAYRPINLVPWHTNAKFEFQVEVQNFSSQALPSNSNLTLSGLHRASNVLDTTYPLGTLQPGEKKAITVRVHLHTQASSALTSNFLACRHPPKVSLSLQCDGSRMVGVEITPHLQDFCRDLKMSRPPPSCGASVFNILLVGSQGVGKSSFINSAFSLVSESSNVLHNVANVGGVTDHVTTTFRRHVLVAEAHQRNPSLLAATETPSPPAEEEEVHIALWDTWGVTHENFAGGEFEAILEGLLPSGWNIKEDDLMRDMLLARDGGVLAGARATAASRKPHAILFFVSQAEVGDEDSMRLVSRNFTKAKRAGYAPMLVIGRADDVDVSVRTDPLLREPSSAGARRTLQGMMKTLADRLQVPEGTVYYSVPYTDEKERRYEIDALTLWNMDAALFGAKQYVNGGMVVGA